MDAPPAGPYSLLAPMPINADNELLELTPEEAHRLLDDKARQYLGITAEEFVTRWREGAIDPDADPNVMRVAMLLPLADESA